MDKSMSLTEIMENPLCPCHGAPMKRADRFWCCLINKLAVYTDESLQEYKVAQERQKQNMDRLIKQVDAFMEKYK